MELQGGVLTDEHEKLKEIGQEIGHRTNDMEKKVGVWFYWIHLTCYEEIKGISFEMPRV